MILEPLDDTLIGILDEEAFEIRNLMCKAALGIDWAYNRNSCALEDIVVIFTEAWSCMYDTAAILCSDIVTADNDERTLLLQVCKVWEERLIGQPFPSL